MIVDLSLLSTVGAYSSLTSSSLILLVEGYSLSYSSSSHKICQLKNAFKMSALSILGALCVGAFQSPSPVCEWPRWYIHMRPATWAFMSVDLVPAEHVTVDLRERVVEVCVTVTARCICCWTSDRRCIKTNGQNNTHRKKEKKTDEEYSGNNKC